MTWAKVVRRGKRKNSNFNEDRRKLTLGRPAWKTPRKKKPLK